MWQNVKSVKNHTKALNTSGKKTQISFKNTNQSVTKKPSFKKRKKYSKCKKALNKDKKINKKCDPKIYILKKF